ncbi:MAG: leucyl aminopeptidase [Frankiales bacterium]|nr:leucyl aminopeptidase [Frankiales bacterium]
MTTVRLVSADPATVKADAVIIGVASTPDGPLLAPGTETVDAGFDGRLTATLAEMGVTGRRDEVVRIPTLGAINAPVLVATGLGDAPPAETPYDHEALRRAAGAAMRGLDGVDNVATTLALTGGAAIPATVSAVAEGLLLGGYRFRKYRTTGAQLPPPESATVLTHATAGKDLKDAVRRAEIVCAGVALTRDLSNTPAADLHPAALADAARTIAEDTGLAIEVLNEKALRKGGYGGLLGVGAGSENPPRLIRLAYEHPRAKKTVALVGKGVTFDSGGLSLKPAQAMEWMKADMSGAAAVIATMQVVAALKPRVNVIGYAPAAENMPGGTAIRPSDVLTMRGGKTVEVVNTDAEGRLILADAISRASEDNPDLIIDVATLTGAQLVALGSHTGAVMSNNDDLRTAIVDAAGRAGEALWPMPLPPELRPSLDSGIADLSNLGERMGGMLVAGLFLKEFVPDGVPWAHVDIAGPAYNQGEAYGYTPKGGTGAAVRTLVQLIDDVAAGVF